MESGIGKSFALQEKAKAIIPGLGQLLSKRPDQFSYGVWPGYFEKAQGVDVWDLDGNQYVDMSIGGIGANVLGYADEEVDTAVISAIKRGVSSSLNCYEEVALAERMLKIHPWADKARFARSGGEAMAMAVRIARAATDRDVVLFCGYHGWQDWYLATNIADESNLNQHLLPGLSARGVPKGLKGTAIPFMFNDASELRRLVASHGKNVAAIIMEPIRNDAPTPEFLHAVRSLATEIGAALIVDEISAGFRLCLGGAHLTLGLEPDISVFSKALGNGYPISMVIGKSSFMDAAQQSFISSTNWTERVGPTAALAMIEKFERNRVHEHLQHIGLTVQKGWAELGKAHGLKLDVGGITPLSHFGFLDENPQMLKALFVQTMLEEGFLASTSFYVMYAHQERHVEAYLKAVDRTFALLAKHKNDPNLRSMLRGQPSASGFARLT